jgi:hypothetical protein
MYGIERCCKRGLKGIEFPAVWLRGKLIDWVGLKKLAESLGY